MARNGKIARLPKWLRDQVNAKLQDGESGVAIVAWLKELWDTNEAIADAVGAEPVNEQNLSAWRQGGYVEWERRQGATELVRNLAEHAQDLKTGADGLEVSDRISMALMGELARVAEALQAETTGTRERWEVLKDVLRELTRVRQADHRAAKLAREQADWEARQPRPAGPDPVGDMERQALSMITAAKFAGSLARKGGDAEGNWEVAATRAEMEFGLPLGMLSAGQASRLPSPATAANKGESSQIKENQADGAEFPLRSEASAGQGGVGTEEEPQTEDPPSSDDGAAVDGEDEDEDEDENPHSSDFPRRATEGQDDGEGGEEEEEGASAPAENLAPGVPQEAWGRQLAADGTLLPPGVHWQFPRRPIQAGVPDKMILVNAAGEEVGPDGQPILEKCGVRSAECGMGTKVEAEADDGGIENAKRDAAEAALDEGESSKIKENQGELEAAPELPPAVFSTIAELPGDGTPALAEEPPEEWEDGGWMKKRPNKGG